MNATKKTVAVIALALLAVFSAAASEVGEPTGNEVARQGALTTLKGSLLTESGEWYLVADSKRYELHLGQLGEKADKALVSGASATVNGFLLGSHFAPVVIDMGASKFTVWTIDRRPSWAGMGNRQYANN